MGLFVGLDEGCDVRDVFMDMGKECRGLDMIWVGVGFGDTNSVIRIYCKIYIYFYFYI